MRTNFLPLTILLFVNTLQGQIQTRPLPAYLNPTIRLGWEFGRGLVIGVDINFGIFNIDSPWQPQLTVGARKPLFRKPEYPYDDYNFISVKVLHVKGKGLQDLSIAGLSVGMLVYKRNKKIKLRPKASFLVGKPMSYLIWYTGIYSLETVLLENKKIKLSLGIESGMLFPL